MHKIKVNNQFDYDIEDKAGNLLVNEKEINADVLQRGTSFHIINDLSSYNVEIVQFDPGTKTAEIKVNGNIYSVIAKDQFDILLDKLGMSNLNNAKISEVKAPMPGLVLKIFVKEGDEVKKGENLFILEAMKMENIIKSPGDVVVKSIKIKPGDKVEKGQVLILF